MFDPLDLSPEPCPWPWCCLSIFTFSYPRLSECWSCLATWGRDYEHNQLTWSGDMITSVQQWCISTIKQLVSVKLVADVLPWTFVLWHAQLRLVMVALNCRNKRPGVISFNFELDYLCQRLCSCDGSTNSPTAMTEMRNIKLQYDGEFRLILIFGAFCHRMEYGNVHSPCLRRRVRPNEANFGAKQIWCMQPDLAAQQFCVRIVVDRWWSVSARWCSANIVSFTKLHAAYLVLDT